MEKNIFEQATRKKMRFAYRGQLSVEELWDLNVKDLDAIYKGLNSQLKQAQEESLLNTKTAADREVEAKIEIVKHIVTVKLTEQQALRDAKAKADKRQELLGILAAKESEELQGKSKEEIEKMLKELE